MKRVFGMFEVVFDVLYLMAAVILGIILVLTAHENHVRLLAGIMAFVLAGGDSFHLVPRIRVILAGEEKPFRTALGRGKQITSVTMTVFYLILWSMGLQLFKPENFFPWNVSVGVLAVVRILLCLLPQNRWQQEKPPVLWGIWRNIPFFLLGVLVAMLFFVYRNRVLGIGGMWFAIFLSFAFYLPVVLWSNKNPKIGMLMLPKTCAYVWMIVMCLSL